MLIHRYWTGPSPEPTIEGSYLGWTDDMLPTDVILWLNDRMSLVLDERRRPYHRANMVRWWLLAHHGGIWADYDVLIDDLTVVPDAETWTAVHENDLRCVRAMCFPANHDVPIRALEWLEDSPHGLTAAAVSGDDLLNHLAAGREEIGRFICQ